MPEVDCAMGGQGGAVVDGSMRTSTDGVFAAGDCAELRVGTGSVPFRLRSSALVMGRTAGRNAVGGGLAEAGLAGSLALDVFGTELCTAGMGAAEGRALGLDLIEMEDDGAAGSDATPEGVFRASMVFERGSHRIYGVEVSGTGALSLSSYLSAVVSSRSRLEDVFYQESLYLPLLDEDASPICLTAGKFLARLRG
jgi:NADPH-dependent 2,4-dienoyl-CoA reductase/sulfur reductase-like enzyme